MEEGYNKSMNTLQTMSKKKLFTLMVILLLIIALPVLLLFSQKRQEVRQHAAVERYLYFAEGSCTTPPGNNSFTFHVGTQTTLYLCLTTGGTPINAFDISIHFGTIVQKVTIASITPGTDANTLTQEFLKTANLQTGDFRFAKGDNTATINGGNLQIAQAVFTPNQTGDGTLTINPADITLTVPGQSTALSVIPTSFTYTIVAAGGASGTPTVTFTLNGGTGTVHIAYGDPVTAIWSSTNATGCSATNILHPVDTYLINQLSGNISTSGQFTAVPTKAGTYRVSITCTGAGGNANVTITATVAPAPTLSSLPAPIIGAATCSPGNTTATLTWSAVTGATRYRIQVISPNGTQLVAPFDQAGTSYIVSNLTPGQTYTFGVTAKAGSTASTKTRATFGCSVTALNLALLLPGVGATFLEPGPGAPASRDVTVCLYANGTNPSVDSAADKFKTCPGTPYKQTSTVAKGTTNTDGTAYANAGFVLGAIPTGDYYVTVYTQQFTRKSTTQTVHVAAGSPATVNLSLLAGDINGDNQVDISDYNILKDCGIAQANPDAPAGYLITNPIADYNSANCRIHAGRANADLTNDGVIDGLDYKFFIDSLSSKPGD